jgi:hypothetical protein
MRPFVYEVALPSATRVASFDATCISLSLTPTSPTPLTTAPNPSAIGGPFFNDPARLFNGIVYGEKPVKGYGGLPIELRRTAVQQRAQAPYPVFLAGEFIRRVGAPTLVG